MRIYDAETCSRGGVSTRNLDSLHPLTSLGAKVHLPFQPWRRLIPMPRLISMRLVLFGGLSLRLGLFACSHAIARLRIRHVSAYQTHRGNPM